MGGMEIMAALSDPALGAELAPNVKAISLVAAPHDLVAAPAFLRAQCKLLLPVFKTVARLVAPSLEPHNQLIDFIKSIRESGNPIVAKAAAKLESWFI